MLKYIFILCIIPKEYRKSSARRNFYRRKNYKKNNLKNTKTVIAG